MYGFFALLTVDPEPPFSENLHVKKICVIIWCYTDPLEEAEEAFRPIRQFGPPAFEFLGPMPLSARNSMFDELSLTKSPLQYHRSPGGILSDEAIALHVEHASRMPTALSTVHLYPIDGAVHRVGKNDTVFSHRETNWSAVYAGIDPDPANAERITEWSKEYWEALHPYSAGGAYVNFMMDEGQERIKATYRDNYERLVAIKNEYGPTNLFRVNQNIRAPATEGRALGGSRNIEKVGRLLGPGPFSCLYSRTS
jgi:hypothetical protein